MFPSPADMEDNMLGSIEEKGLFGSSPISILFCSLWNVAADASDGGPDQNIESTSGPVIMCRTAESIASSGMITGGSAGLSGICTTDMYKALNAVFSRSSWANRSRLCSPRDLSSISWGISRAEGLRYQYGNVARDLRLSHLAAPSNQ